MTAVVVLIIITLFLLGVVFVSSEERYEGKHRISRDETNARLKLKRDKDAEWDAAEREWRREHREIPNAKRDRDAEESAAERAWRRDHTSA